MTGNIVRGPWKAGQTAHELRLLSALETCEAAMSELKQVILRKEPIAPEELRNVQARFELALRTARELLGKQ